MSATHSFSPRKPGCVLLAADIRSLAAIIARAWQRLGTDEGETSVRNADSADVGSEDPVQPPKGSIDEKVT